MNRIWMWVQVGFGWLPIWALYTAILVGEHGASPWRAASTAARDVIPAALLGLAVTRFARSNPWPRPLRFRFFLLHVVAGIVYAFLWVLAVSVIESGVHERFTIFLGPGVVQVALVGLWLYAMVAAVSYLIESAERTGRAEAAAAKTQLATLRDQLQPHFLFNALHAVVQLIPLEPARAANAAEDVAALLRSSLQQNSDVTTVRDEWAFVSRYVDIERMRFGDRLEIVRHIETDTLEAELPTFTVQTLVENAIRHGASPRVQRTTIAISISRDSGDLLIRIVNPTATSPVQLDPSAGTGLARLRERLYALYGSDAQLEVRPTTTQFEVTARLPLLINELR